MMTDYLRNQGFRIADGIDLCVFVRGDAVRGDLFIALLHVDDLMLIAQNKNELKIFRDQMKEKFGEITYHDSDISFLGMNVMIESDGSVFLNQPGYAKRICDQEGGVKECSTPATATLFSDVDSMKDDNGLDSSEYKSLLMSLMFLGIRTRPDILKECTFLASFAIKKRLKN
jgi:hypothetical protein